MTKPGDISTKYVKPFKQALHNAVGHNKNEDNNDNNIDLDDNRGAIASQYID